MKQPIITLLAIGVLSFQASAQQKKEEKKEMRVIIKTDENGTETVVDTVINLSEIEAKIDAIDIDAIIDEVAAELEEGWDETAKSLKKLDMDLRVNGKRYKLDELDDLANWVGEAMEGVSVDIDDSDNISISCTGNDAHKKMTIVVDGDAREDGGIILSEENVEVNLDEDGKGNIIIKSISNDDDNEDVSVWIEDDGNVVVNGGSASAKANAKVKVIKVDDGTLVFSDEDSDDIDVKVITDKSGNSEATVMVKKIIKAEETSFENAPDLPNGLTLQVYPNPNNGEFQLTYRNEKKVKTSIVVYDAKGTEVFRKLLGKTVGLNKETLELSHLRSGNYILKLELGNSTASQQFVIR